MLCCVSENKQATVSWKATTLIWWPSQHRKYIPSAICTWRHSLREYFNVKNLHELEPFKVHFRVVASYLSISYVWLVMVNEIRWNLDSIIISKSNSKMLQVSYEVVIFRFKTKNQIFVGPHIIYSKSTPLVFVFCQGLVPPMVAGLADCFPGVQVVRALQLTITCKNHLWLTVKMALEIFKKSLKWNQVLVKVLRRHEEAKVG